MPRRPLSDLLADDWRDLNESPAADPLLFWCRAELVIQADKLNDVVRHVWGAEPSEADRLLARIARLGRHDTVAARLLLHLLRPGLRTLAFRLGRSHPHADADQELLAIAWEKIRTYPIDRRPRSVAANILLDTRKQYLRWIDRGHAWINLKDLAETGALLIRYPSAEHQALDSEEASMDEVRESLISATEDGTITPTAAHLIWRTRIAGEPDPDVAADFGVNVRTMQRRRQRAERRLQAAS